MYNDGSQGGYASGRQCFTFLQCIDAKSNGTWPAKSLLRCQSSEGKLVHRQRRISHCHYPLLIQHQAPVVVI